MSLAVILPRSIEELLGHLERIDWYAVAASLVVLALGFAAGLVLVGIVLRLAARATRKTATPIDDLMIRRLRRPLRVLVPLILLRALLPVTELSSSSTDTLQHLLLIAIIFSVAHLIWRSLLAVEEAITLQFDADATDNLRARQITTQLRGLRNVASFLIWVLAAALSLTTFDQVRQFGVTLLASAGVAGIVIGFAAQRSISTLIAGIQIAFTQPIRVEDVVVVEGEWGRIEEITLTYVVIKIWDLRRLVVPINYFIENSFENWTRNEASLLGPIYLELDYSVDLDALRAELTRLLDGNDKWDGKVSGIVVTEARERGMQVRALVSAANSGDAWDLRCQIREGLLAFVHEHYPESLPRMRAELVGESTPLPANRAHHASA